MRYTLIAFLACLLLRASSFNVFKVTPSRRLSWFTRLSLSGDDTSKKDAEQEVKDLNLEEMFEVFEAAETAADPAATKPVAKPAASNMNKSFPDFSDPQDWITIGLTLLIVKNTSDIILEFLAKK